MEAGGLLVAASVGMDFTWYMHLNCLYFATTCWGNPTVEEFCSYLSYKV